MKERITVLLGAGAMIEATGISTKYLTEKVILKCKQYKISEKNPISVVDVICNKILDIYKQEILILSGKTKMEQITSIISFEDISCIRITT